MREAQSGGLRIRYDDSGNGEPALLYLPGWATPRWAFDALAERTAKRRRSLVLDWRGHGDSDPAPGEFSDEDLLADALAVIEASGVRDIVPVAMSHAGFVAIELRRRLGDRVRALVLLDWIILDPPPPFVTALELIQQPDTWLQVRNSMLDMWLAGTDNPALERYVRNDVAAFGFEMWARAARTIMASYRRFGNPLKALSRLDPPVPALHLYAQPADPGYLQAQQAFASQHPWFHVERLDARSHLPMFEIPDSIAETIERFVSPQ